MFWRFDIDHLVFVSGMHPLAFRPCKTALRASYHPFLAISSFIRNQIASQLSVLDLLVMSSIRGEAVLSAIDVDAASHRAHLAVAIACCVLLCAQGIVLLVYRPWGFLYVCPHRPQRRPTPRFYPHRSPPKPLPATSYITCSLPRWPRLLLAYRTVTVLYMLHFSVQQLATSGVRVLKFYTVW